MLMSAYTLSRHYCFSLLSLIAFFHFRAILPRWRHAAMSAPLLAARVQRAASHAPLITPPPDFA